MTAKNNPLVLVALLLGVAILAVLGVKLLPLLHPDAEQTLPATACNPGTKVCITPLPGGGQLELTIDPHPIRPLQTLQLQVNFSQFDAENVSIDFQGSQMDMGLNRPQLAGSHGRYSGQTLLPVCITGTMEWKATVLLGNGRKTLAIPFLFEVAGR